MYNVVVVHGNFKTKDDAARYAGEISELHIMELPGNKQMSVRVMDSARRRRLQEAGFIEADIEEQVEEPQRSCA